MFMLENGILDVVHVWLQPVSCERPKISNLDELTTKTMAPKSAAPNLCVCATP